MLGVQETHMYWCWQGIGRLCHGGRESKHGNPKGVFKQQGDLVGVVGFLKLWYI